MDIQRGQQLVSHRTVRYESPRLTLMGPKLAPPVELARWLLEQRRIPYLEESHAPIFHVVPLLRNRVDLSLPLLLAPEGPYAGISAVLEAIDRLSGPGERVFGDSDSEIAETRKWLKLFTQQLFKQAVQLYYRNALDDRPFAKINALHGTPLWQRGIVHALFPCWKWRLRVGLGLGTLDVETTYRSITDVFDEVEQRIAKKGPFLCGKAPGTADILFASFASPVVMPDGFGAPSPSDDELPIGLADIVRRLRERPAGKLVQEIYAKARPETQPVLQRPQAQPRLSRFIEKIRFGALVVGVKLRRQLKKDGKLFLWRWHDVTEVLAKDSQFLIEPVNGELIEQLNGPFVLGMDRNPRLFAQREHLYKALHLADKEAFGNRMMNACPVDMPRETTLQAESKRVLSLAERDGRLDVVNGYARLVAGRTAAKFFGIHGPTEQDFLRVLRALFYQTFLNFKKDPDIARAGNDAAEQFKEWVNTEIANRRSSGAFGEDVLGQLLKSTVNEDPSLARRLLGGMMVGSVDTTATAVTHIVSVALNDETLMAAMKKDMGDEALFRGWCWEALRRLPLSPIMRREAGENASVNGRPVESETPVVMLVREAMHDPAVFERPDVLDPRRPLDRYLHFGQGLHQCTGRDISEIQIPVLVKSLLRYEITQTRSLKSNGPLPDSLIVSVKSAS